MDRNPIERIFCEKIYVATNSLFPRGEGQVVLRGQLWEVEVLGGILPRIQNSFFFTFTFCDFGMEILGGILPRVQKVTFSLSLFAVLE